MNSLGHRRNERTMPRVARCRGVGLVELMVSLVVVAAVLTAVAAAVNASFAAYRVNEVQSELMQQTRVAVNRITASIRVTSEHAPDDPAIASQFAAGATVTGEGIAMLDEQGADVVYRYDRPGKRLLAIVDGQQRVLARGVEAFYVRMEPMRSATSLKTAGAWDLLQRATIVLTVSKAEQTVTATAAVAPRQNTW